MNVAVRSTSYASMASALVARQGTLIEHSDGAARVLELDATLVFADISGFTALSERLAKKGRVGAELVNQLLSISFSAMLDVALSLGADLISFGGDALCLLFHGDEHPQRAVAAAHGLRSSLRRTASLRAPIDRGTLKISTGVHCGPVVLALVGSETPMLVTLGSTLTRTLQLEGLANGGEVLISRELRDRLDQEGASWVTLEPRGDANHGESHVDAGPDTQPDAYSVTSLRRRSMPWLSAPQLQVEPPEATFGCDPAIALELQSGRTGLEHRQATICFIHYEGIDTAFERNGVEHTIRLVDRLMSRVQRAAATEGVTVLSTDVDKDGGKIVLAAGIPLSTGLEHDRLLAVVYSVVNASAEVPLRIGVNAGTVFVGPVGSPTRATYTIIGDTVNTTARIMAKAQVGQALVAPAVLQSARTPFSSTEIAPFPAKGKATYLRASALGRPLSHGGKSSDPTRLPFRGREAELGEIENAISVFRAGRTALVEVIGEGGLGKSRLIEETLWRLGGLRVMQINGSPFARSQGYFALHTGLRSAAGLSDDDPAEHLRRLVQQELPEDEPLLPLLGAAFGCDFPETDESRLVAEQFRSGVTNRLVRRLLHRLVGPSGVVVVVDDSHWLDEASCALIRELIDDDRHNWFFLIARRPEPTSLDLSDHAAVRRLELTQLDLATALVLAEAFALEYPLPDEMLRAAVDRADGSPLLLELVLEGVSVRGQHRPTFPKRPNDWSRPASTRFPRPVGNCFARHLCSGWTCRPRCSPICSGSTPRTLTKVLRWSASS